jgi:hypothetical protein
MASTAKPKHKTLARVATSCFRLIYQLISSSMALPLPVASSAWAFSRQKKVSPAAARYCRPHIVSQCRSGLTSARPVSLVAFVYSAASAADTAVVIPSPLMGVDGLPRTASLQSSNLRYQPCFRLGALVTRRTEISPAFM